MPPVEFELTILVSERPQTHALDRAATGINAWIYGCIISVVFKEPPDDGLWRTETYVGVISNYVK
jgi:hypothetical protein